MSGRRARSCLLKAGQLLAQLLVGHEQLSNQRLQVAVLGFGDDIRFFKHGDLVSCMRDYGKLLV
jgi:hypothetical protein